MTFGETLKRIITVSGIKGNQLASALGYDASYISRWMSGEKMPANVDGSQLFYRIAEYIVRICNEQELASIAAEMGFHNESVNSAESICKDIEKVLKKSYLEQKALAYSNKKVDRVEYNCIFLPESDADVAIKLIAESLSDLEGENSDKPAEIIIAAPICFDSVIFRHSTDVLDCFYDQQRPIHVKHVIGSIDMETNIDEYCRYFCMNAGGGKNLDYEYYMTDQPDFCNNMIMFVKDKLYCRIIENSFSHRKSIILSKDYLTVAEGYRTAERYLNNKHTIFEKETNEQPQGNNHPINYMFEEDYFQILNVMHPICIYDEQHANQCGINMVPKWGRSFTERMYNAQKTVIIFRTALAEFINNGKIAVSGEIYYLDVENRANFLKQLLQYLSSEVPCRLMIVEDNNPLLNYKELKQSIYVGKDSMHTAYCCDNNSPMTKNNPVVVNAFRQFSVHLTELPEVYIMKEPKTFEFIRQAIEWLEYMME